MSRPPILALACDCALIGALVAVGASWADPAGKKKPPAKARGEPKVDAQAIQSPHRKAEEAIRQALNRPVTFEFIETPLEAVAAYLEDTSKVRVVLDHPALSDDGIDRNVPMTLSVKDIPLRSALRLMLRDLHLTYLVRDEVLLITTPEEAETQLECRVYPVGDLLPSCDVAGRQVGDFDALKNLITTAIAPRTWDIVGGPGSLVPADFKNVRALVISQTRDVHDQVDALLAALRAVAKRPEGRQSLEPVLLYDGRLQDNSAAETIRAALAKGLDLEFVEESLSDVVDYIHSACGIACRIDARALNDVGVSADTPITGRFKGISLRSALRLLLRDVELTYVIRDGVLSITTPEEAESNLTVGIYPLGDLVVCRDENDEPWDDYDWLVGVVLQTVHRKGWDSIGGPGSIAAGSFGEAKVLVVRHTLETHDQIARLLRELRAVAAQAEGDGRPPRRRRPQVPGPERGQDGWPVGKGFF